jgi:hypothetical protein
MEEPPVVPSIEVEDLGAPSPAETVEVESSDPASN